MVRQKEKVKSKPLDFIVDPGHGGQDPGAVKGIVSEKTFNLYIAYNLWDILTKEYNLRGTLTRLIDNTISLSERCKIANDLKVKLFISVHCNAHTNEDASGFEVFYYHRSILGKRLSELIIEEISKVEEPSPRVRGAKPSDFYVLKHTNMPAVLIEYGFITNKKECLLLLKEDYVKKLNQAIARAVRKWFDERLV